MSIITYLTTIRFEFGAIQGIQQDLTDLGIHKPLIIADEGVAKAGLVGKITAVIDSGTDLPVFTGTPTNPTQEAVETALSMYRAQGCDSLIAVGGGSPIDLAKGVALLASHEGPLERYAAILGGIPRITAAVAPIIAVPTTAGTGSEVGRASLITLKDGRKLGFISPHLIPKRAVCDPEMTLGLPSWLTAATGMDAVTHCIETYLSPRNNPPAEAIALDGLKRAVGNIEKAVGDGSDCDARYQMMMAALEGGLTFQKGLGAVHALSHPLGGLKDMSLHHGTLNAVILPTVLRFNQGHAGQKYAVIRSTLGLSEDADLADCFAQLSSRLGLPKTLGKMGVPSSIVPAIARAAVEDHSHATNAKPATVEDYVRMLSEAIG